MVVTGVILGLLLSAGSVAGLEFMRDTTGTPGELERLTGYPVLATLPVQPTRYLSSGPAAVLTTGRVIAEVNKPRDTTEKEEKDEEEERNNRALYNMRRRPDTRRSNVRSAITITKNYEL